MTSVRDETEEDEEQFTQDDAVAETNVVEENMENLSISGEEEAEMNASNNDTSASVADERDENQAHVVEDEHSLNDEQYEEEAEEEDDEYNQRQKRRKLAHWRDRKSFKQFQLQQMEQRRREEAEELQRRLEASNIVHYSRKPVDFFPDGSRPVNIRVYDIRSTESYRLDKDEWEGVLIVHTISLKDFMKNAFDVLIGHHKVPQCYEYLQSINFFPVEYQFLIDILADRSGQSFYDLKSFSLMMRADVNLPDEAYDKTRHQLLDHIKKCPYDERPSCAHRRIQLDHRDMVIHPSQVNLLNKLSDKHPTTVKHHAKKYYYNNVQY